MKTRRSTDGYIRKYMGTQARVNLSPQRQNARRVKGGRKPLRNPENVYLGSGLPAMRQRMTASCSLVRFSFGR